MKKYVQKPTNLYSTFCKSVGHDEKDCRAYNLLHEDQGIHVGFKEKHNKMKIIHSSTPQEEETSTLAVDSEEEDEEEVWVKVEEISSIITTHSQDI
jgi:hypothetical protein